MIFIFTMNDIITLESPGTSITAFQGLKFTLEGVAEGNNQLKHLNMVVGRAGKEIGTEQEDVMGKLGARTDTLTDL